jgi:5-formyltetrahydrofolate cyclo-ligase
MAQSEPCRALPDRESRQAKTTLRRQVLAMRASRDRGTGDAARAAQLLAHPWLRGARIAAMYASTRTEPSTTTLRARWSAGGRTTLLPIPAADHSLAFAVDDGPLRPGPYGVGIPAGATVPLHHADVVLVPALAVDRGGYRLGRGGGSYDRALADLPTHVPVIALLHPGELLEHVPHEVHDVPVHAVALPGGVVVLRGV